MKSKKIIYIAAAVIVVVVGVVLICVSCGNQNPNMQIAEFPPEPEPSEQQPFPDDNRDAWVVLEPDATWEGYADLPFDKYLKKGIPAVHEEIYEVKKCAVVAVEGWNAEGLLDESTLSAGNKAVTYVADTIMVIDGEDTVVGFKFYMELTPENTLKVVAYERYQQYLEWGDVLEGEEANQLLEDMKEYM